MWFSLVSEIMQIQHMSEMSSMLIYAELSTAVMHCLKPIKVSYVKEYQELTPLSRICTCMPYAEVPYFQMGQQKNPHPPLHQIFRACRGHKVGHNGTVLRGSDEGILRGKGGRKIFDPPISPPLGARERSNFSAWQRPIGPMTWQNIGPQNLNGGLGDVPPKNFAVFWVACGAQ